MVMIYNLLSVSSVGLEHLETNHIEKHNREHVFCGIVKVWFANISLHVDRLCSWYTKTPQEKLLFVK